MSWNPSNAMMDMLCSVAGISRAEKDAIVSLTFSYKELRMVDDNILDFNHRESRDKIGVFLEAAETCAQQIGIQYGSRNHRQEHFQLQVSVSSNCEKLPPGSIEGK